jgi:hypothetical protein
VPSIDALVLMASSYIKSCVREDAHEHSKRENAAHRVQYAGKKHVEHVVRLTFLGHESLIVNYKPSNDYSNVEPFH